MPWILSLLTFPMARSVEWLRVIHAGPKQTNQETFPRNLKLGPKDSSSLTFKVYLHENHARLQSSTSISLGLWEGYLIFRIFDLQDVSDAVGLELRIFLTSIPSESGGFPGGSSGKESACQCRRHRFGPWFQKIPWRRKWQPIPVFLLGNPMDRGAWCVIVHRLMKSLTWLRWQRMHQYI